MHDGFNIYMLFILVIQTSLVSWAYRTYKFHILRLHATTHMYFWCHDKSADSGMHGNKLTIFKFHGNTLIYLEATWGTG